MKHTIAFLLVAVLALSCKKEETPEKDYRIETKSNSDLEVYIEKQISIKNVGKYSYSYKGHYPAYSTVKAMSKPGEFIVINYWEGDVKIDGDTIVNDSTGYKSYSFEYFPENKGK